MGEYKSCSMCGNCKSGKVKVCQLGHKIKSFQWIANCKDWQARQKSRTQFKGADENYISDEELAEKFESMNDN